MRGMRAPYAQERHDVLWQAKVALQRLRVILRAPHRHPRQAPWDVPALAHVKGDAIGHGMLASDLQEGDAGVLGDMAHSSLCQRGLRCRVPGRHLGRARCGRAYSGCEGPCPRMASGPVRMRKRLGRPHAAHASACHGGHRRGARVLEGRSGGVARDSHPALHLPCVLPGEKMHDEQAEPGSGQGALFARQEAAQGQGCRLGCRMARRIRGMVREGGAVLAGIHAQRRQEALRPRASAQGLPRPRQARALRRAVHVRGDGRGARRDVGLHQQHDRRGGV